MQRITYLEEHQGVATFTGATIEHKPSLTVVLEDKKNKFDDIYSTTTDARHTFIETEMPPS